MTNSLLSTFSHGKCTSITTNAVPPALPRGVPCQAPVARVAHKGTLAPTQATMSGHLHAGDAELSGTACGCGKRAASVRIDRVRQRGRVKPRDAQKNYTEVEIMALLDMM